jgi:fatty acid-binding protein DegV
LSGFSLEEVARRAVQVRERTHLIILLNTIEYVRRGGRADALMPLLDRVTQVLKIKPLLTLTDGRLSFYGLARSYERGLDHLQREIVQCKSVESLAVIHTRCADVANRMARSLAEKLDFPLQDIHVGETGPLLSTHAGAKVVGVAAVRQE